MKKRPFSPNFRVFTCAELGIDEYDHEFKLRADPSKTVLLEIIDMVETILTAAKNETEVEGASEFDYRFHEIASYIFEDCDIEGADFSTPETTKETFERRDIDGTFFTRVFMSYVEQILREKGNVKKAQASET